MRHGTDQAPFYWVLALFVAGLSLASYGGYVIYPRFDLPAAAGIGLLVLSIGAGVASFFSPCSFPLLARQAGSQREADGRGAHQSLPFGAALAAGASMFFLIAGIIVAFGGGALLEGVTFTSAAGRIIRVAVGGLLVVLGLFQLNLLSTPSFHTVSRLAEPLSKFQARQCRQRPVFGFAVFGLGYPLAGFG